MAKRLSTLEGLRGLAAVMILLHHFLLFFGQPGAFDEPGWIARFAHHLEIGVPIFFVLSGFLLYRPWAMARARGEAAPHVPRYVRRRLARIVPAYWVALTAAVALGLSSGPIGSSPLIYYGFLQTYSAHTFFNGLNPAWSLCVEMSFYAALPLLAFGIGRWAPRIRWQLALGGGLTFAVLAVRALSVTQDPALSFTLLGTFDWFAVGMLIAGVSVVRPSMLRRISPGVAFSAAAALWVLAGAVGLPWGVIYDTHPSALPWVIQHIVYTLIAGLCLAGAVAAEYRPSTVARALSSPVGQWLGRISYGIFLWQIPVIFGVAHLVVHRWYPEGWAPEFVLVVVLTCAVASASWYALERPILNSRLVRGRRVPSRPPALPQPAEAG